MPKGFWGNGRTKAERVLAFDVSIRGWCVEKESWMDESDRPSAFRGFLTTQAQTWQKFSKLSVTSFILKKKGKREESRKEKRYVHVHRFKIILLELYQMANLLILPGNGVEDFHGFRQCLVGLIQDFFSCYFLRADFFTSPAPCMLTCCSK